jgi:hypothetical protein
MQEARLKQRRQANRDEKAGALAKYFDLRDGDIPPFPRAIWLLPFLNKDHWDDTLIDIYSATLIEPPSFKIIPVFKPSIG